MGFIIADHITDHLESAIAASRAAERGAFYDALWALCAFAAYDLGRQVTEPGQLTDKEMLKQLDAALKTQLSRSASKRFELSVACKKAVQRFGTPDRAMDAVEDLAPVFARDFRDWEAAGRPKPTQGLMQRLIGPTPGCKEDLLNFAQSATWFASSVFDDDSEYPELERRAEIVMDDLPN